jgi:bis(5'-nucleosyl)-tetraphosphatase (symmetrical)
MAIYAIGDVQGCYGALQALLARVKFDPAADRLWLVGDLVNRGSQSLEVLRFVKSLGASAVTVLGNHDLHLIAAAAGCAKLGKGDTLQPVLQAPDRDELLAWLRAQHLAYAEGEYLMVHAGLLPQWSAADVLRLAGEVEALLRSDGYENFLKKMYGNHPAQWDESLTGDDRTRVIVNAMTRMRFCTAEGSMEFREKGGPQNAPDGYFPWFDAPGRKTAHLTMVCGHWSAMGFVQRPDLLALDSGCVWGNRLTAVRLDDRQPTQLACSPPADQAQQQ